MPGFSGGCRQYPLAGMPAKDPLADDTPPALTGTWPADNASGVDTRGMLYLAFSEPLVPGSGSIRLFLADGTLAHVFDITDTTTVRVGSGIEVDLGNVGLDFNRAYRVAIDPGAVTDAAGNAFSGLADASFTFVTDDFDAAGTVASIEPGAPLTGALSYVFDTDGFRVQLAQGATYRIQVGRVGDSSIVPGILVLDANGDDRLAQDAEGSSGSLEVTYEAAQGGLHTIVVSSGYQKLGGYSLKLTAMKDDQAWNPAAPPVLGAGSMQRAGTLDFGGDRDLFELPVERGRAYLVELVATGHAFDPAMQTLWYGSFDEALSVAASPGVARAWYGADYEGYFHVVAAAQGGRTGAYTVSVTEGTYFPGTRYADQFIGTPGVDVMRGALGNDVAVPGPGNDRFDGDDGIDSVILAGPRGNYTIAVEGSHTQVQDAAGSDGQDLYRHVDRLYFTDVKVALDIVPTPYADGLAGIVAKTLGAVFGPGGVQNAAYAGAGLYLMDGGMTTTGLMELALGFVLGAGATHAEVANLLFTNLMQRPPTAAELAFYVGMLDSGEITPVGLGLVASGTPMNLANIGWTALQATGIEYL